jgi:hypothetical protein
MRCRIFSPLLPAYRSQLHPLTHLTPRACPFSLPGEGTSHGLHRPLSALVMCASAQEDLDSLRGDKE